MGRPIETTRRHARNNLAHTLHSTSHVASRPADLSEAFAMQGKARAIQDAVKAGLLPDRWSEVAALLSQGAHATRELAQLQAVREQLARHAVGMAAAYCSEKQLAALDGGEPLWRPRPEPEPEPEPWHTNPEREHLSARPTPSADCGCDDCKRARLGPPEDDGDCKLHPAPERVRIRPNLNPPRAELALLGVREAAKKYGTSAATMRNAFRKAGIPAAGMTS